MGDKEETGAEGISESDQKKILKSRGGDVLKNKDKVLYYLFFEMPNRNQEQFDKFVKLIGCTSTASFIADERITSEIEAQIANASAEFKKTFQMEINSFFDGPFKYAHPNKHEFFNDTKLKAQLFEKINYDPVKDKEKTFSLTCLENNLNRNCAAIFDAAKNRFNKTPQKTESKETKENLQQNNYALAKKILYKGGIVLYGMGCLALAYIGVTQGWNCSSNWKSELEKRTENLITTEASPLSDQKEALKYQLDQKMVAYNNSPELSDKLTEIDLLKKQGKEKEELYQLALKDLEQTKNEYSALETQLNQKISAVEEQYAVINSQNDQNTKANDMLVALIDEQNKSKEAIKTLENALEAAFKEKGSKQIDELNKISTEYKQRIDRLAKINEKLTKFTETLGTESYTK